MNVGFIGLGAMGLPMARRVLSAGHTMYTTFHRRREPAEELRAVGATILATPAEVAAAADVVITILPADAELREVVFGATGILGGVASGKTLIEMTSGTALAVQEIAAAIERKGGAILDAPVSGGTTAAKAGTLTVMWGGEITVFERVRPVIEAFGKKIVHAGPVGAGDALKAVNNALLAVHILSAAEGLAILVKAGVDPKVALDVINASSGRSNSSENLIPQRVLTRAFPRTFRLALLEKDIGIAAVMADDLDARTPLLSLTAERFHEAREKLGESADHVEAVKLVEEENGVEIK